MPLSTLKFRPLWTLCQSSSPNNTSVSDLGAICSIGLDGLCILPNADVLACRRLPIPIGNLLNDDLEDIWMNSKLLNDIADKRNLIGKCKNCKFISNCSGCRAMAYAYSGNYLDEDPHCWYESEGMNKM